jgi:hypothetical protein
MATSRRQVKSLTDLNAKQILVKKDSNDNIVFEVSGALGSGKVTVNVPLTASAIVVTGSSGLVVNNGGVTINNNTGLVINSNGVTVNSGGADITGLVTARNGLTVKADILKVEAGAELSGSTTTSGSLTVNGNGLLTANNGVTVNGAVITANAGLVVNNSALLVNNGGISGSATLQAGGDLTVGGNARVIGDLDVQGNMVVRGTPTIINSDVLEIKDNIVIINKVSGTTTPASAYQTVSGGLAVYRGGGEEASVMWVSASNDWQLTYTVAGTASSADLGVNKLKVITLSGSSGLGVSSQLNVGAPLFIQTTASFANLGSLATSSVTVEGQSLTAVNVDQALHAIDTAIGSIGTSVSTLNAYKRLRYQATGSLVDGSAVVDLPTASLGAAAFPTASFNYVNVDVRILEDGKWVNDLVSVELVVTGAANDSLAVLIDAAAAPTATYRILAVNEDVTKYVAV